MKSSDREVIFDYIFSIAETVKREGAALIEILDYPEDSEEVSRKVTALETEADSVFHDIALFYQNGNLARDPEAITLLDVARSVEGCSDAIDQLAMDFYRYNVTEITDEIYSLLMNIMRASNKLIELMFSIKKMDKLDPPIKYVMELDAFKVEAEKIYNENMRNLFTLEKDAIEVVRWKSIYESFRTTFASYENVADLSAKMVFFAN